MTKRGMFLIALLVLAVGLLTYSPMVYASHTGLHTDSSHSDLNTQIATGNLGLRGLDFRTLFIDVDCYLAQNCSPHAEEALSAWFSGGWFEPRGGTEFIPPSGDHHRAGWRLMLQPAFSAGDWLTGFGGQSRNFPWYPTLDEPGAGESPTLLFEACDADIIDPAGDGVPNSAAECDAEARRAAERIAIFLDNHGEPLTPGRFPRYIPHDRQAWVGTVVSKYTASAMGTTPNVNIVGTPDPDISAAKINQLFTSMHKIVNAGMVTWFSMHDQNGAGCASGWCQWVYDAPTGKLYKLDGVGESPGTPAVTLSNPGAGAMVVSGTPLLVLANEVTTTSILNDLTGEIDVDRPMNRFEKAPSEIYQVVGQFLMLGAGSAVDGARPAQNMWSEFWGLSGPNFQAMEGVNPNTWVLCGTNVGTKDTESSCIGGGPEDLDESDAGAGTDGAFKVAITNFGSDTFTRWGADARPAGPNDLGGLSSDCGGTEPSIATVEGAAYAARAIAVYTSIASACDAGVGSSHVVCRPLGDTDGNSRTSSCDSVDGDADGIYGDAGEDITFVEEVQEEGLRGYLRLDRHYAFSFLNGLAANWASIPEAATAGGGMFKSLRQSVTDEQQGFLMSCLNCENTVDHTVTGHSLQYNFTFGQQIPGFEDSHPTVTNGNLFWSSP